MLDYTHVKLGVYILDYGHVKIGVYILYYTHVKIGVYIGLCTCKNRCVYWIMYI
jgi:hypothetical protein